MNIRRILFRLWAIAAVAWIGGAVIGFVVKGAERPEIFLVLTSIVFILATVLAIGRSVFWIVGRFKKFL